MKHKIHWLLFNVSLVTMLWFGLVEGYNGPRNVGLFFVWFLFLVSVCLSTEKNIMLLATKKTWPAVPSWVNYPLDLFIVVLLVWHERWYAGSAYLIHTILSELIRDKVEALRGIGEREATKPPDESSEPHKVSDGSSEYDYYRRVQMAEGKLQAMTVANNKALAALRSCAVVVNAYTGDKAAAEAEALAEALPGLITELEEK